MSLEACPRCRRAVAPKNLERHLEACQGDASATCILYGCGLPAQTRRLEEISGDGRSGWRAYCERHDPERAPTANASASAIKPGPRQRPSELAERLP